MIQQAVVERSQRALIIQYENNHARSQARLGETLQAPNMLFARCRAIASLTMINRYFYICSAIMRPFAFIPYASFIAS